MRKRTVEILLVVLIGLTAFVQTVKAQTTLEECLRAVENYPLVRRYGLIEQTREFTVESLGKGWLPQLLDTFRPELQLFSARLSHNDALRRQLDTSFRPTLSLFADGYYGYPGMDAFADMFSRNPSLNGIFGVRLSWNIGRFYTRRNDYARLEKARQEIENDCDVFLFNNRLKISDKTAAIEGLHRVMAEDEDIIALLTSVRQSAETRLAKGVITVSDLLQEITRENQACILLQSHEIELLKAIYELKNNIGQ